MMPAVDCDLPDSFNHALRWYQEEAVEADLAALQQYRSCLNVLATGLGKTVIFCEVAKRWRGRVLILAHREELIEQARERLEQQTGEHVEIEQAGMRSDRARLVVGSVLSVCRANRLERMGRDRFSLIIPDECHHATAASYLKIFDWFKSAKILGVTATPDRGDGTAMGKVFEHVAYKFDILDGIEHGYLVPFRGQRVDVEQIDISHVSVSAGDLAQGQLDEVMVRAVEGVVTETLRIVPEGFGPLFFPGVKSAELACQRFNHLKPGSAAFISANTPTDERRELVRDVKRGRVQYLCNVGITTEGFDWPEANFVGMARPTKSRSLYTQMAGRGGRPLPGCSDVGGKAESALRRHFIATSEKPACLILDFVGNSGQHALVGPEDILGGRYKDPEIKMAKLLAKKNPGAATAELLEQARRELAKLAKDITSQVKSRVRVFDPFVTLGLEGPPDESPKYGYQPITARQRDALLGYRLKEEELDGLTKNSAGRLIEDMKRRRRMGLCTFAQSRALRKQGVDPTFVRFTVASQVMDYLFSLPKGHRPDPAKVDEILHRQRDPGED